MSKKRLIDAKVILQNISNLRIMAKNHHVVPLGNGWAVQREGARQATVITSKQSDAIAVARDLARKNHSELIIHGRNGKIRARNSYGTDPHPPKG